VKSLANFLICLLAAPLLASAGLSAESTTSNSWVAELPSSDLNTTAAYVPLVIAISGPVISEITRKAILDEAHKIFPFETIQDGMRTDPIGIDQTHGRYALAQLAQLDNGRVVIASGKLSLYGQTKATVSAPALEVVIALTIPSGLTVGSMQVGPRGVANYTLNFDRSSNSINIAGYVPSLYDKAELRYEAVSRFPEATIIDNSMIVPGAPDGFLSAAKVGLKQLQYASAYSGFGSVRLSNSDYSLVIDAKRPNGVPNDTLAEAIKVTAETELPSGFKPDLVTVVAPKEGKEERSVDLLFATDRVRKDQAFSVNFGPLRAHAMTFGAARVHIPEDHRFGNIELANSGHQLFGFTIGKEDKDPKKHFIITNTEVLDFEEWKKQLSGHGDEAIVFVHGYNTTFQDAIFRFAQIVWDLQYKGPAVLFSWPSKGELLSYEWDRNSALFAREDFIELIKLMEREAGIKKIHVIAHSMGNFVALDALSTYAQTADPLSIGQVVMAAPDIDADQYKQDVSNLTKIVAGMTLYASDKDAVILASRALAQGPRAGDLVNGSPILAPGVDAIDVSAIGSEELGIENHDTFATKRSVIDDIKLVLAGVRPPTNRLPEIRGVPEGASNPIYWRYAP
jgi:esterase/lipase superfamily enzyme